MTLDEAPRRKVEEGLEFYRLVRNGVPVQWRDAKPALQHALAKVIDLRDPGNNRFLAVRELKVQRLSGGEQRRPGPLWLHHQQVGAPHRTGSGTTNRNGN